MFLNFLLIVDANFFNLIEITEKIYQEHFEIKCIFSPMPGITLATIYADQTQSFITSLLPVFVILLVIRYFKKKTLISSKKNDLKVEKSFIYNYYFSFIFSSSVLYYLHHLYISKDIYKPIISSSNQIHLYMSSLLISGTQWIVNQYAITGLLALLILAFSPANFFNYTGVNYIDVYTNLLLNIPLFLSVFGYSMLLDSILAAAVIFLILQFVFNIQVYSLNKNDRSFFFTLLNLASLRTAALFYPEIEMVYIPGGLKDAFLNFCSLNYLYISIMSVGYILIRKHVAVELIDEYIRLYAYFYRQKLYKYLGKFRMMGASPAA